MKLLKNPVVRVTQWKMHDDTIHISAFLVLHNSTNFPVIGSPKLIPKTMTSGSQATHQTSSIFHNLSPEKSPTSPSRASPVEDGSILASLENINLQPGQTKHLETRRWAAAIAK